MALTTLTAINLTKNSDPGLLVSQGLGTAINTADVMRVLFPKEGKLIILIDSDNSLTQPNFKAGGTGVGAGTKGFHAKGIGDLQPAVILTATMQAFMVDSSRFKNQDGFLYFDWEASSAGFVQVVSLPE